MLSTAQYLQSETNEQESGNWYVFVFSCRYFGERAQKISLNTTTIEFVVALVCAGLAKKMHGQLATITVISCYACELAHKRYNN